MAPGVDLSRDVLQQIGFPVKVSKHLRLMDRRLFQNESMDLIRDFHSRPARTNFACTLKGKCAVVTGGAAGIVGWQSRNGWLWKGAISASSTGARMGRRGSRRRWALLAFAPNSRRRTWPLESVRRGVAELDRALGPIDILVNNAGILKVSLLAEMPAGDWEEMFRVNVHGVFNCSQAVLPGMMARRCGRIINLASWKGKRGTPYTGAYSSTKFAVIGYTESLAQEVGSYNITVNAICPGMVEGTEMMDKWQQTARQLGLPTLEDRLPAVPLGRAATVADIANMAAFLASEEAAYITGRSLQRHRWNVDELKRPIASLASGIVRTLIRSGRNAFRSGLLVIGQRQTRARMVAA